MKHHPWLAVLTCICLIFFSSSLEAKTPKKPKAPPSFNSAKNLMPKIYTGYETTFYCGCKYQKKDIQEEGCAYQNKGEYKLSWEHLTPASSLGGHRPEWKVGHPKCVGTSKRKKGKKYAGRSCLEKSNKKYRAILGNPYNLYPAILRLNIKRQNYDFTEDIPRAEGCNLRIKGKTAYVSPKIQGEIARNYLYLQATYPEIPLLTPKRVKKMYKWSALDPPDAWECLRAKRIREHTGLVNPFTEVFCSSSVASTSF